MTREEAIEILKNLVSYECGCSIGAEGFRLDLCKYRVEALEMAIKTLEAEPKLQQALEQEKGAYNALVANVYCEDCISREAMHIELEKWITYGEYKYSNATKYLYDRIDRLPAVSPQPKVGKWFPVRLYANGNPVCNWWECSECGWEHEGDENTLPACCPNCRAEMEVEG